MPNTKITVDDITKEDLRTAYKVIVKLMSANNWNYETAWTHVRSKIACAFMENFE